MTFKQLLIQNALIEWAYFGKKEINVFGNIIRYGKQENSPIGSEAVRRYWQIGCDIRNRTGKDRAFPWSSAFISYIMKVSGAGENFKYSAAHCEYIQDILKRQKAGTENLPFTVSDINQQPYKEGDLLCYHRLKRQNMTFKTMPKDKFFPSHGEIITKVMPNYLETISGNVGHGIPKRIIKLIDSRTVEPKAHGENWFCHIQNHL